MVSILYSHLRLHDHLIWNAFIKWENFTKTDLRACKKFWSQFNNDSHRIFFWYRSLCECKPFLPFHFFFINFIWLLNKWKMKMKAYCFRSTINVITASAAVPHGEQWNDHLIWYRCDCERTKTKTIAWAMSRNATNRHSFNTIWQSSGAWCIIK